MEPSIQKAIRERAKTLGTSASNYVRVAIENLGGLTREELQRQLEYRAYLVDKLQQVTTEVAGLNDVSDLMDKILGEARDAVKTAKTAPRTQWESVDKSLEAFKAGK